MTRNCDQCGVTYSRKGTAHRYCSHECSSAARKTESAAYRCEGCGTRFTRRRNGNAYKFCSRECSGVRGAAAENAQKMTCKNGHLFSERNTLNRDGGQRRCRQCYYDAQHRYLESGAEAVQRWNKVRSVRRSRRMSARNDESRLSARNHMNMWTGPELEVACRDDLTNREVAAMLGRTIRAVESIRRRIKVEPKIQQLAGVGMP